MIKVKDILNWSLDLKDIGWKLNNSEGDRNFYVFMPINTLFNCFSIKIWK
jgi:hypothetical protein